MTTTPAHAPRPDPPGSPGPPSLPAPPGPSMPGGRPLSAALPAIVGYTLRACLPVKRWFGVLLPCVGALLFGLLSNVLDDDPVIVAESDTSTQLGTPGGLEPVQPDVVDPSGELVLLDETELADADNFADVAELGLFALILPLTCLVVGDAVLGADSRAGTFQLTWLSPVPFQVIAFGRWFGGWLVTLVSLVPAMALAPVIAGVPDAAGPMAVATMFGAAAYIALFMVIGVVTRRSALWSLAIVLLGEWLLATTLDGVAQISPLWEAQQLFAGLWSDGILIERDGLPLGWASAVRLVLITVACLGIATWRLGRMRPISSGD